MRDHVKMMGKLQGDAHSFMVADLAFARMVVRATKNLAYELLFNSVVRTVEGNRGIELAFFANARSTLAVYERLLDRMDARDDDRARATASRLLHRLDRTTVDALTLFLAASVHLPTTSPTGPTGKTRATETRRSQSTKRTTKARAKPARAGRTAPTEATKTAKKKRGTR